MRPNNYRKDVNNSKPISTCNYFKTHGHEFMKYAKFTLMKQTSETTDVTKDTLRLRFERLEDFWIIKFETLTAKGLN